MLKDIQVNVGFGGPKREVKIILFPFRWKFGKASNTDPHIRCHTIYAGPITVLLKRLMYVLCLLLITGSIAQAAEPYYRGTPPNAIYRQSIQIPIYQPGVRIYYRSQHVPVPGFGTIITNKYRYAQTRAPIRQPGSYNHSPGKQHK